MGKIATGPTAVVLVTHVAGILGPILYGIYHGFTWAAVLIALVVLFLTTLGVSAGYHRLFSHGTYEAHWSLRAFLMFWGSAALEGSVFKWAALHRRHHMATDTDDDPHSRKKGFWWSHLGWVLHEFGETKVIPNIDDLKKDPILRFQDKFYVPVMLLGCVLMPLGAGFLLGDPWGGLVIGSFLRTIVFHHITWFINSLAHTIGSRKYCDETAGDSLVTAVLTMGEGYHNYHHAFPYDYRNGVSPWSYDPTKWIVFLLSKVGITRNLVRAAPEAIEQALARSR